ncbi:hypothetical protein JCM3766R1_000063 [Sporobolomyces carnicolor]
MAPPQPLDVNIPTATARVTRSTSLLHKEVVPTSEDQDMDDHIVLAPLPSGSGTGTRSNSPQRAGAAAPNGRRLDTQRRVERDQDGDDDAMALDRDDDADDGNGQPSAEERVRGDALDDEESEAEGREDDDEDEDDDDDEEWSSSDEPDSDVSDRGGEPKSPGEKRQIEDEMRQLEQNVPEIENRYKLVDRLGEGTFSSVYKAIDVNHSKYDNSQWQPKLPPNGKVYVALKRIYVTSSPVRIHNELEILADLRGASNVAYLIDAIRHEDQVLAVMPYNRHQDFRSYFRKATLPMLRSYFSCIFRALAATHKLQIIHRDVKPANFLFDVTSGEGVLCDYGLAQKIGGDEFYEWKSECLHSLPGPSWGGLAGRRQSQKKLDRNPPHSAPGLASGLHGVRLAKPLSLWEQTEAMKDEHDELRFDLMAREGEGDPIAPEEYARVRELKPWKVPEGWRDDIQGRVKDRQAFYKGWRPAKFGSSVAGNRRIGYLKEDRRPSVRANRAGTRGFRAPEVLLKCPDQTVALDIWSVGIILLCFLTRRFPFFNSNDDFEALAEITAIFGKRKMERCAAVHNRTFVTNVPDLEGPSHASFHALVKALNPPIVVENSPNPYGQIPSAAEEDAEWYDNSDLFHAVDLLKRCLELDCTKRWTAEECLEHPFFSGVYDLGLGRTETRENGHDPSR